MGIHKGTKLTDTPKNTVIRARIDEETANKLDVLCTAERKGKSEIIRDGIDRLYQELKQNTTPCT